MKTIMNPGVFNKCFFAGILFSICLSVASCGGSISDDARFLRAMKRASTGTGAFGGTYSMTMKVTKDGCGLGIKGQTFPGTAVIVQNKTKITVSVQGLGKPYKGTVTGNTAKASGSFKQGGVTFSGSVDATLRKGGKLKITKSDLNIKGQGKNCTLTLTGNGDKV